MNSSEQTALESARQALAHAYAPYSGLRVASALVAADGRVFTGVNMENHSFGLTICAERAAVARAISEGAREFKLLAIVVDRRMKIVPCGACLQVLSEFCDDLEIVCEDPSGEPTRTSLRALLPSPFEL